jgi:hypothetical protein
MEAFLQEGNLSQNLSHLFPNPFFLWRMRKHREFPEPILKAPVLLVVGIFRGGVLPRRKVKS